MLRLNTNVELTLITTDGVASAVTVRAPIRGEGLRTTKIVRSEEPEIFAMVLMLSVSYARGGPPPEVDAQVLDRLVDVGYFVSDERLSRPVRFHCDLDDPPVRLVPRRSPHSPIESASGGQLLVNPDLLRLQRSAPEPLTMNDPHTLGPPFAEAAWARAADPVLRVPAFYSLDARWDETLASLTPGTSPPSWLDAERRRRLAEAGILLAPGDLEPREATVAVAGARERLRADRYAVLRHVLHPWNLAALRRYYRDLVDEGYLKYGDDEWPHRYFSYREPVTNLFHRQLAGLVSSLADEPVKPSFCYVASYQGGSELPPHRDREQCEYSISVLLDYDPEPEDESPWPLYLENPGSPAGAEPVRLGLGDLAIYRGRELSHHRERLADSHFATYWFLFYVPEGFSGSLD